MILLKYAAIFGEASSLKAEQFAWTVLEKSGLRPAIKTDCFQLFTDAEGDNKIEWESSLILGKVFEARGARQRIHTLAPHMQEKIIQTRGQYLIDLVWGGYVAFHYNEPDRIDVIRDPSAMAPCYYMRHNGLTVIASHIDLIYQITQRTRIISWSDVARHLLCDQFRAPETCLEGAVELLGGQRLSLTAASAAVTQLWSPWRFVQPVNDSSPEQIAEALRDVVQTCITVWASSYEGLVLGVSGGLDSSIVAACLKRAKIPFRALTLVTKDFRGDERRYARLLMAALGLPLDEVMEDASLIDVTVSDARHLPRPIARSFAQTGNTANLETARRVGADAFISGGGGDNVFCYMQSGNPIADRLLVEGPGLKAFATAVDMAQLSGCSVFTALSKGIRNAYFRRHNFRWPVNNLFLTEKAARIARPVSHPWLEAPKGALPGKAAHIAWLMHIQNHLEGLQRETTLSTLWPLMSQPVMEFCLAIPTWAWCAGGQNRVVAREAFRRYLPPEIIDRRTKGTPDTFMTEIFDLNRKKIWDLLSEGELAKQGLLDLNALQSVLLNNGPATNHVYSRVLMLADVEAWSRSQAKSSF